MAATRAHAFVDAHLCASHPPRSLCSATPAWAKHALGSATTALGKRALGSTPAWAKHALGSTTLTLGKCALRSATPVWAKHALGSTTTALGRYCTCKIGQAALTTQARCGRRLAAGARLVRAQACSRRTHGTGSNLNLGLHPSVTRSCSTWRRLPCASPARLSPPSPIASLRLAQPKSPAPAARPPLSRTRPPPLELTLPLVHAEPRQGPPPAARPPRAHQHVGDAVPGRPVSTPATPDLPRAAERRRRLRKRRRRRGRCRDGKLPRRVAAGGWRGRTRREAALCWRQRRPAGGLACERVDDEGCVPGCGVGSVGVCGRMDGPRCKGGHA
eukprot:359030-Chlamydomonas_euryale.AAC.5